MDGDFVKWAEEYRPNPSLTVMLFDAVEKWEDWAADHPEKPVNVVV